MNSDPIFSPLDYALFWSKVEITEACWEWQAGKFQNGRGSFKWRGRNVQAYRIAWQMFNGRELRPGEYVLHHCDNPGCVRPDHLFTGTDLDNVRDKIAKGRERSARGDEHYQAKLTAETVQEIRRRFKAGERNSDLAKEFGVTRATICDLIYRRTWDHIT